jgi:hypothetical protein
MGCDSRLKSRYGNMGIIKRGQTSEFDAVIQSLAHIQSIKEEALENPMASSLHEIVASMWRAENVVIADPVRLWFELQYKKDVMTEMLKSANISNIAIIEITEDHLESPHLIPDDLGVSGAIVFKLTGLKKFECPRNILIKRSNGSVWYTISSFISKHDVSEYSTTYKNSQDTFWYLAEGDSITQIETKEPIIETLYMIVYEPATE